MPLGIDGDYVFHSLVGLERLIPTQQRREVGSNFLYFRLGVRCIEKCSIVSDLEPGTAGWTVPWMLAPPQEREDESPARKLLRRVVDGPVNASLGPDVHLIPGQSGTQSMLVYRNNHEKLKAIVLYQRGGVVDGDISAVPTAGSENIQARSKPVDYPLMGNYGYYVPRCDGQSHSPSVPQPAVQ